MKIFDYEEVKMNWDSFTYPIAVGTPVSIDGVLADNASAHGLIARTVFAKPDADETLKVMTGGIIDMEEIVAGYGQELSSAAVQALCGIHFYKDGVCIPSGGGGGGVTPEIMAQIENAQWKTETSEQLFSETVTTVDDGERGYTDLSYSELITADTLIVTFNGTEYICPAQKSSGNPVVAYGATFDPVTGEPNWDACPFFIQSLPGLGNNIYTETAGTYTVSASAEIKTYTDAFKDGVNANIFKEVESISEADVVVINFLTSVAIPMSLCSITGNADNVSLKISPNVYQRNFVGEHIFWKTSDGVYVGDNARLFANGGTLTLDVTDMTQLTEASNLYTFSIRGSKQYPLTSNYTVKYYNIGIPSTSTGGDGGGGWG